MKFYFEEAELWQEKKASVIRQINQLDIPLVIFGRSGCSNPAFLQDIIVPVQFICSTNPASWGKTLWGLEVVSLDRIQHEYQRYSVLILPIDYNNEFYGMFQRLPNPPVKIFALDLHFDEDGTADYFKENQSIIEEIYEHMADQESKDTYETMIRYRINRESSLLNPVMLPPSAHYFMDSLGGKPFLGKQEVFVDVGAFTGDTVREFVTAVHGQYRKIYALEPIPSNFDQLLKTVQNFTNVLCIQAGVGNSAGTLRFASVGQASRSDPSGEVIVQVDTLDNLLGNIPVSYIKMDIEGMEQSALQGARNLIQTYRPKLGICIYHSNEDMVRIPKQLLEFHPDYRLYCRQYTPSVCDTVCYAI